MTAEAITAEDALSFLAEHYGRLFEARDVEHRFLVDRMTEAKRRWAEEMDFILLRLANQPIGLFVGHPTDWSTYYIRSVGLLQETRGRHVGSHVVQRVCERLTLAGVERVEADVPPTNAPSLGALQGQGFLVTSVVNSERWGSCLRLTKFLSPEAEAVFSRQFCVITAKRKARGIPLSPTVERSSS